MYTIVETNNTDSCAIITDPNDFIVYVKDILGNIEYIFIEATTPDRILKDNSIGYNTYVIQNTHTIILLEKIKVSRRGYIYSSNTDDINILRTWKLIPGKEFIKKKPEDHRLIDVNKIPKLDIKTIGLTSNIAVIAKRGSGKSFLIKNFIEMCDEDFIKQSLVISPREEYKTYFGGKIAPEFNSGLVESYIENGHSGAIILDRCVDDFHKYNDILGKLFSSNKLVILILQYPTHHLRKYDINYYFLYREDFLTSQKNIYGITNEPFGYFSIFRDYLLTLTDNFGCMVIDKAVGQVLQYKPTSECEAK